LFDNQKSHAELQDYVLFVGISRVSVEINQENKLVTLNDPAGNCMQGKKRCELRVAAYMD
jgi:hypothetical protein